MEEYKTAYFIVDRFDKYMTLKEHKEIIAKLNDGTEWITNVAN